MPESATLSIPVESFKADGARPIHTQVIDRRKTMGVEFAVTGTESFAVTG